MKAAERAGLRMLFAYALVGPSIAIYLYKVQDWNDFFAALTGAAIAWALHESLKP